MRPLIIAHRGASHLAPENTLTAFRLAKTLGADGFECDVQITRDRHLVVAHDYLTDLKTGVHGNIPDMDFDDLRQLFRLDPELVVTNKPEVAVSILTGLGQWDESSKEG